MAANSGGSTAARKRAKDSAMAAQLKAEGVVRNVFRCPICNGIIQLSHAYGHISFHKP